MSWSSELFCNISYNRETFNSKEEVKDALEATENYIKIAKERIRDLVMMTEPQKFCPENYDTLIWLQNEIEDSFETLNDSIVDQYKLNLLLKNWEACHNEEGLAINPPKEINWKTAYLSGDFVKTVD